MQECDGPRCNAWRRAGYQQLSCTRLWTSCARLRQVLEPTGSCASRRESGSALQEALRMQPGGRSVRSQAVPPRQRRQVDTRQFGQPRQPEVRHHAPRRQPRCAHYQQIAAAAIPPVQRMTPGNPWHAERIRPVREQMHQAAACEAERRRRERHAPEPVIRRGQQKQPADTPMRGHSRRWRDHQATSSQSGAVPPATPASSAAAIHRCQRPPAC
jgi:hypothetical protein